VATGKVVVSGAYPKVGSTVECDGGGGGAPAIVSSG
jgi:hypothetical protein